MARIRPIRDAALAVTLLTAIPLKVAPPGDDRTDAAGWFPAVGLLIGGIAWLALHVILRLGYQGQAPTMVGALIVTGWALLTRLMHWDGLADVGDGWWGSEDRERRLEIMSDPHVGAFGVTTVVLVALVEVASLATIVNRGHQFPLLVVPVFARLAATFAAWFGHPARSGGLGRSVMGRPRISAILPAAIIVVPVLLLLARIMHYSVGWLGLLSLVTALVVPDLLSRRFGGVTGDVMGASVLLTETLLFVAFAIWF